ncbi:MAG: LolA-related protein [Burkholderiaceae bacterium]
MRRLSIEAALNKSARGRAPRIALLSAALAAACALATAAFAQGGFDLEQLMQALAQNKGGQARFVERRHTAILEQTLESSGRLSFEAPDTFIRETLEPRRERVVVVGNRLTLTQGARVRSLALDATPEAAVMVEAIRGTLTGNREAIERHFKPGVSGDAQHWRLELVPRDSRLQAQVRSIVVIGHDHSVREVTLALTDGDRSVMSIEPLPADAATPIGATPNSPSPAPGGANQ